MQKPEIDRAPSARSRPHRPEPAPDLLPRTSYQERNPIAIPGLRIGQAGVLWIKRTVRLRRQLLRLGHSDTGKGRQI